MSDASLQVKLGVAPIAWSNDDLPELGGDTPLEECLREARQAGYRGIESGGKFPMDAAALGPLLQAADLQLASGWFSGRLWTGEVAEEKKRIGAQLDTFLKLGAKVIVYGETAEAVQSARGAPVSRRPQADAPQMRAYARRVSDFAKWLAAQGMATAYHPHIGALVQTAAEIDALLAAASEEVGLLFDSGHLSYAGASPLAVLEKHGERVNHVHLKDVREDVLQEVVRADAPFIDAIIAGVFTVPGDGGIDYAPLAKKLAQLRYQGWLIVEAEQDPAKANPLQYAIKGRKHSQAVFQAAGFSFAE
jgi:inosose dehydratase